MKYLAIFFFVSTFYIPTDNGDHPFKSKKLYKNFTENYPYIPSGVLNVDGKRVTLNQFYMFNHEVTNLEYREYMNATNQKVELVKEDMDDSQKEAINYLYHPAYDDYPVRNLTAGEVNDYCIWLQSVLAESYEIDAEKITVRLPSKEEWIYAAKGGHEYAPYSWGGYYIRNAKGKMLANFNSALGATSITLNQETGEYEIVEKQLLNNHVKTPAPSVSFYPNDYGLYNMCGNIAEMVRNDDGLAMGGSYNSTGYDIRTESKMKYKGKSNEVGFRPVVQIKS